MSKEIHSNAADMHRAVALLRAKVTGDKPTETVHIHDVIGQDRLGNLVGPLLEISSHFVQTMIRKGALDAASFLDWITALESGYLQAELDGPDGDTND
ncbi:hypothetical protein ACIBM3_22970 [Rhodococcus erythropolis]|uniref:hypothetical protein n=1 Tax=Rhodococcus erythropolis TaxID=1833 RepID=UPI00379C4B1E